MKQPAKPESMKDLCKHYGVASLQELPTSADIYPKFYPKGCLVWMFKRLDCLTVGHRKQVSEELEQIYLKQGSRAFCEYLDEYVKGNGSKVNQLAMKAPTHSECVGLTGELKKRVDALRQKSRSSKSKILAMADHRNEINRNRH